MKIDRINPIAFTSRHNRPGIGLMVATTSDTSIGDEFALDMVDGHLMAGVEVQAPSIYIVVKPGDAIQVGDDVFRLDYEPVTGNAAFAKLDPADIPAPEVPQPSLAQRFFAAVRKDRERGCDLHASVRAVRAANPEFAGCFPHIPQSR